MNINRALSGLSHIYVPINSTIDDKITPVITMLETDYIYERTNLLCILPKESFKNKRGIYPNIFTTPVECVVPPMSDTCYSSRLVTTIPINKIIPLNNTKPIEDRLIKEIEHFKFRKINKISEYVKEEETLTFITKNSKCAIDFIKNSFNIGRQFKFCHYVGIETKLIRGKKYPKENLLIAMRFNDISKVIPIYDKRHVDGMNLQITIFRITDKEFAPMIDISMLFSNFKENLLEIDGQKVREIRKPSPRTIREIITICSNLLGTPNKNFKHIEEDPKILFKPKKKENKINSTFIDDNRSCIKIGDVQINKIAEEVTNATLEEQYTKYFADMTFIPSKTMTARAYGEMYYEATTIDLPKTYHDDSELRTIKYKQFPDSTINAYFDSSAHKKLRKKFDLPELKQKNFIKNNNNKIMGY